MKKINVSICMGVNCFTQAIPIKEELTKIVKEQYNNAIDLTVEPCFRVCGINQERHTPPYVKVNDTVIAAATTTKVLAVVDNLLSETSV